MHAFLVLIFYLYQDIQTRLWKNSLWSNRWLKFFGILWNLQFLSITREKLYRNDINIFLSRVQNSKHQVFAFLLKFSFKDLICLIFHYCNNTPIHSGKIWFQQIKIQILNWLGNSVFLSNCYGVNKVNQCKSLKIAKLFSFYLYYMVLITFH